MGVGLGRFARRMLADGLKEWKRFLTFPLDLSYCVYIFVGLRGGELWKRTGRIMGMNAKNNAFMGLRNGTHDGREFEQKTRCSDRWLMGRSC